MLDSFHLLNAKQIPLYNMNSITWASLVSDVDLLGCEEGRRAESKSDIVFSKLIVARKTKVTVDERQ